MPFQKNKAHKAGRRAGKSAREKHEHAKGAPRKSVRNGLPVNHSKQDRHNMAKQQRENKRDQLLQQGRAQTAPRIIAVLPMSKDIDVAAFWKQLLLVCQQELAPETPGMSEQEEAGEEGPRMTTTSLPGNQKAHITWLPPPQDASDPLAVLEVTKSVEGAILLFSETAEVDESGEHVLNIMRHNGLPSLFPVIVPPLGAPLKVRAASKKLAAATLEAEGFTDHRISLADNAADFQQLLRHIGDTKLKQPQWKQQRPNLLIEAARLQPGATTDQSTLVIRGYVRSLGLSANRGMHLSGVGDFLIDRIERAPQPDYLAARPTGVQAEQSVRMDEDPAVLATPDPEAQDGLERENKPDPLNAEQTWPTEEEMADADNRQGKRMLPKGTSAYQAGWILDDNFSDEELEEVDVNSRGATHPSASVAGDLDAELDEDDAMRDAETTDVNEDDDDEAYKNRRKPTRQDQSDDFQFPDEIDTPEGILAKERFAKYRGLKSWRSSPWDPKESLPSEYARIFAFQSVKRAEKRAKQEAMRAGGIGDVHAVAVNTYVDIHLKDVPIQKAQAVVERVNLASQGQAAALMAFGLLQHETRLSVLNYSIKKVAGCEETVSNKQKLLFITGFRSFMTRPILSSDEPGATKFKMERFLQPGQNAVATDFAPISYPPLPLLAFLQDESSGKFKLVATGSLKSTDPDRVILKRIVLSGYPVKVTKKKAVVRWMFHGPEDVRWFKPVELWTKHGLRGRITEPVGTHGAMKCLFDGGVTQQDAVCASLYKRVFPKWPLDMDFA